jgi:ABC-type lipoprotein export system ATPase subunit
MNTILKAKQLTKVYGVKYANAVAHALSGIELEVFEGEFVSVMGPSGSGKTTLLNILAGLDRPTSGDLWLKGQDYAKVRKDEMALFRRRNLGFVFQDFNLLDTLTVAENVVLPLVLDGKRGGNADKRIVEVLSYLGMEQYLDRYPHELSGGQQQRTAVARAIVHHPELILADEPTGNLDSGSAKALLETFQRLNGEEGVTTLMVTHDPFAASYSTRVVFIKDGRVFSQLNQSGNRQSYYQEILSTLAVLEGSSHDLA